MDSKEISRQNHNLKELIFTLADKKEWKESWDLTAACIEKMEKDPRFTQIHTVYLVGHGTSLAGARTAEVWLGHIAKVHAHTMPAYHFLQRIDDYLLDPVHTMVLGYSTGGNTESVIGSVTEAGKRGALTIGMAGEKESELAGAGTYRIISSVDKDDAMVPGKEFGGGYSVSHIYAMLASFELALALGQAGGVLDAAGVEEWKAKLAEVIQIFGKNMGKIFDKMMDVSRELAATGARNFVVIGAGPNVGTVAEGALKICEYCWDFGAAEDLEDLHHGRFRELGDGHIIFIVAPGEKDYLKTMDILVGAQYSRSPTVVFTAHPTAAMEKLSTAVVRMPEMEEYLTPFFYILPLWFYGFARADMDGALVGEKRYGLYARDINFQRYCNELKQIFKL